MNGFDLLLIEGSCRGVCLRVREKTCSYTTSCLGTMIWEDAIQDYSVRLWGCPGWIKKLREMSRIIEEIGVFFVCVVFESSDSKTSTTSLLVYKNPDGIQVVSGTSFNFKTDESNKPKPVLNLREVKSSAGIIT